MSVAGDWRPVPGYWGYECHHDGTIRSFLSFGSRGRLTYNETPRVLNPYASSRDRRRRVTLYRKRDRRHVGSVEVWAWTWPELAKGDVA